MPDKQSKNISLETLQKDIARLDAKFNLLLIEMRKDHIRVEHIDTGYRKIGFLFEETDAKFKLTLEGYMGMNYKLEKLEARMGSLEMKMEKFQETMEKRFEALEARMKNFETHMKEGFEILFEKLDQKVDRKEFAEFAALHT